MALHHALALKFPPLGSKADPGAALKTFWPVVE
jgi:hypothetical protein